MPQSGMSITIQNSNMATAKPEIVSFHKIKIKAVVSPTSRQDINEIPKAIPMF